MEQTFCTHQTVDKNSIKAKEPLKKFRFESNSSLILWRLHAGQQRHSEYNAELNKDRVKIVIKADQRERLQI